MTITKANYDKTSDIDLYAFLVNEAEHYKWYDELEAIAFCIGYFGKVDSRLFDLIRKLRADGFIK